MGSIWLLRGLYVQHVFSKSNGQVLRGSYGAALRKGVTNAKLTINVTVARNSLMNFSEMKWKDNNVTLSWMRNEYCLIRQGIVCEKREREIERKNPINFINVSSLHQRPLVTMGIGEVKWINRSQLWQAEMAFIHVLYISWKGNILGLDIVSQNVPYTGWPKNNGTAYFR